MGSGRVDGRPVMVAAEDFTVKAGTISQAANAKRYRVAEIALLDRVPLVMMLDGAGFRADGRHARPRADRPARAGRCSGRVPLVTAVLGSSAGHGALVAPMSDFTVMSSHAAIFTAGPPVVLRVARRDDHEGGARRPVGRGRERPDPQRGAGRRRRARPRAPLPQLLPVLGLVVPARRRRRRHRSASRPRDARHRAAQRPAALRHARRARRRLRPLVVLRGAAGVREVGDLRARPPRAATRSRSIANQPRVLAGSIDVDGADKAAHFITVADSFHLPLVFLADNPGVHAGQRVGEARHPAQRRAHVRGADARDHARSSR